MSEPVTMDTTQIDWTKELSQEWYTNYSSQLLKSFIRRHHSDSSVKKPAVAVNASPRKHEVASFLVTMPDRLTSDESYLDRPMPSEEIPNGRNGSNLSRSSGSSALSSGLSHREFSFAHENLSQVSQRLSLAPAEEEVSQVESLSSK